MIDKPSEAATAVAAWAEKNGVTIRSEFVPWSQSRNKAEKHPSLNWNVTIVHNGRDVLTTDYMAGSAHAPSYGQRQQRFIDAECIKAECERGFPHLWSDGFNRPIRRDSPRNAEPIQPKLVDVLSSLAMDSDVLDHPTFESWASDLGFDLDSWKAEAIYRLCLQHALALRAAFGDAGLSELRDLSREM